MGFVWEIFNTLSRSRQVSDMGHVTGILSSEITQHLAWLGVPKEEQLQIFNYISALDTAYLHHIHKQIEERNKQRKNTR